MKWPQLLAFVLLLSSCESFTRWLEDSDDGVIRLSKGQSENIQIAFSHNINAEAQPCGCRQFPLGGMPQVAGILATWKKTSPLIYVDTGDTFFPSTKLPKTLMDSMKFTANQIAHMLDLLGLQYFVPGDQDFAAGIDFLAAIAENHQFKFLITNLKDEDTLKHLKFKSITLPNQTTLYLFGVINPKLLSAQHRRLFLDPVIAIKKQLAALDLKQQDRVIVLSHQGMDKDIILAKKIAHIDWIIGAHDQRFTQTPHQEGSTKIVQVLSRNHHLGRLNLSLSTKKDDTLFIQEVREQWQDKLQPNPLSSYLAEYTKKLKDQQKKEAQTHAAKTDTHSHLTDIQTANHCLTCHEAQGEFWMSTSHASAFHTLVQKKMHYNTDCIGCHALYFQDPKGFNNPQDFSVFPQEQNIQEKKKKYLQEFTQLAKDAQSIRAMGPKDRLQMAHKARDLDKKYQIQKNFAHVQCLHCHQQTMEHPFEQDSTKKTPAVSASSCLHCHTVEQSPEWYESRKGENLKQELFKQKKKQVACPLME